MSATRTDYEIFLPTYRGRLTEGITYNPANNTVLWIDIIAGEVHRVSLSDASEASHEYIKFASPAESVGAIALTRDNDKVLVCCKYGVAVGSFATGEISYILRYPHDHTNLRSNDGIVDQWGNLWIGTMTDFFVGKVEPHGRLYHINSKTLEVTTMLEHCQIANGLAFSRDGKTLYWTDSLTFQIWKFDYDYATNTLSNRRSFVDTRQVPSLATLASPEPDGLTMTAGEEIYGAVFSSSRVVHYSSGGEALEEFTVGGQRVTCCIIGGPHNDTLFVTTGQLHLDEVEKCQTAADKEGDLGGYLFKIDLRQSIDVDPKNVWGGAV